MGVVHLIGRTRSHSLLFYHAICYPSACFADVRVIEGFMEWANEGLMRWAVESRRDPWKDMVDAESSLLQRIGGRNRTVLNCQTN